MEPVLISALLVTIAEIGDQTQLLAIFLASRFRKPWPIIAGILVATIGNHLLAATVGYLVSGFLKGAWVQYLIAASFIGTAIWALFPDKEDDSVAEASHMGVFLTTVVAFFIVEMGDKTQIATISLAARFHSIIPVVTGTTLGMMIVNIPTVLFADQATKWIPVKVVRVIAAGIYALLGVLTLFGYSGGNPG